jgi:hypothetical protein
VTRPVSWAWRARMEQKDRRMILVSMKQYLPYEGSLAFAGGKNFG